MASAPPPKKLRTEVRKLGGMQRELYSLMGDNNPPILVRPDSQKSRPDWRQKVTPWSRVPFVNQARDDDLKLKHWVRGSVDPAEVYRFARYNTSVDVPSWTDEEYQLFENPDWTLEETRHLFDLARLFDLRWPVIFDRYDRQSSRTVEDLKARYYDVCSSLLRAKPSRSPKDEELLEAMKFSKELEEKRKAHLERLVSRPPSEVAEEEALVMEARRLEASASKILHERSELLELLESPPVSNSGAAQYNSSQGVGQLQQQLLQEKGRKIKDPQGPSPVRKSLTGTDGHSTMAVAVLQHRLTPKEEQAYGVSYEKHHHSLGVYLRSSRLPTFKHSLLPKAQAVMNELGIPMRPVMPTLRVCQRREALYSAINTLLEAKRVQDKLETEIEVLKRAKSSE